MPPCELLAITAIVFAIGCWGLLVYTLCRAICLKQKCERLQGDLDILHKFMQRDGQYLVTAIKANAEYRKEIKRLIAAVDEENNHET